MKLAILTIFLIFPPFASANRSGTTENKIPKCRIQIYDSLGGFTGNSAGEGDSCLYKKNIPRGSFSVPEDFVGRRKTYFEEQLELKIKKMSVELNKAQEEIKKLKNECSTTASRPTDQSKQKEGSQ